MVVQIRVPKISTQEKSVIDYSRLKNDHSKIRVVESFDHPCEVNKARAMKQDNKIIASLANSGDVLVFTLGHAQPSFELKGLEGEGFGLSWNPLQKGVLVGATGTSVCLWAVDSSKPSSPQAKIEKAHESVINDAKFSNLDPNMFGTASDDHHYKLWDMRAP